MANEQRDEPYSVTPDSGPEQADETASERKVKRRRRIQLAITVLFALLLFGVILPQVIDYGAVWDAATSLSSAEFSVLLFLGFIRIAISASQHAAVIPSLRFRQAVRAYLASGTLAEVAPPPADLAVRYGMYRAQGVDAESAGVGILLTGLFDNAVKLLLPVVALGALIVVGLDDATVRQLFLIGLAALSGVVVLVVFIVRSEKFTMAFGRFVGRVISWFLIRFRRNPLEDLGPKTTGLRALIGGTLRTRWIAAMAATIGTHVMNYVILLVALRYLGVDAATLDWAVLLVAYALVTLLTVLPLTPGGIGISSLGYTWLLAPDDPQLATLIASASMLNKVFTWLLPIVVGFIPLIAWRRGAAESQQEQRTT